jgi:ATP-dependent Lhr-like helicase
LPGARKSTRQIQASSSLFYEVFRQYDADNRLLRQAEQEVLSQELDAQRLQAAVQRLRSWAWDWVYLRSPSPFCLPLMVERLREQLSTEQLTARIERWVAQSQSVEGVGEEALAMTPGRSSHRPGRMSRSGRSGRARGIARAQLPRS